ncbi:MAG: hypothetical protein WBC33_06835 [Conexibacter sp.]
MSALLEPPTTDAGLRDQAQVVWDDIDQALAFERPEVALVAERAQRVAHRQRVFEDLRAAILLLVRSPAWRTHELALELLLVLEDLRAAIEHDPDAVDPQWHEREALMRMRVVVQAMLRQLDHLAIDSPPVAAKLVAETLADLEPADVARLLGATTKSLENWRHGRVEQIKRNPSRIALIGQLVYELRNSMTPRGVLLWFDAPREQFGGRTPRELLDADVADAASKLLPLARGGRGQLDV